MPCIVKHCDCQYLLVFKFIVKSNSSEDTLPHPISIECEFCRFQCFRLRLIVDLSHSATEDTVLPLAFPITGKDGKQLNEIFVPKKTVLTVSIVGVNRSTAVWGPDANKWNPERWLGELPSSVKDSRMPGIYSHMYALSPRLPVAILISLL